MSDKVIKAIVCPGCGELSKAEIHTSINPARDKTIRKRVLDGGRIISPFVTERTMKIIGITVGIILSFFGALVAIYTRSNFLILVVSLYVLIGAIK